MRYTAVVAVGLCLLGGVICQDPVIIIPQGNIRGITRRNRNDEQFFSFRSIPYAAPPLGDLRFRDPRPAPDWQGVRDATRDMPYCVQSSLTSVIGSEDCLYLNVHTRELPPVQGIANLRPVMVWIHGGLFFSGSGNEQYHNPEFLMTQNVVLVTINYRLNMFGFFSLDDNSLAVPGNAGLKDQVMALRWIANNIGRFGGDPSRVTIFGQGSGAASVHYHMLSPLSRGSFHRAIMQSGSAIAPWTAGIRNNGLALAQELNVNTTNRIRMMDTLRWLTQEQIFEGYQRLSTSLALDWGSIINPVIERQIDGTAFLIDNPVNLIERGQFADVPLMIGYTDSEGIALDQIMRHLLNTNQSTVIHDFAPIIPPDLNIAAGSELQRNISTEIQNFYFPNEQTMANRTGLIKLFRDVWIAFPALRTAIMHLQTANASIFIYRFSADTALNVFKRRDEVSALIPGASHEDDIAYLFRTRLTPTVHHHTLEDFAINRMVTLWSNFALDGRPADSSVEFTWTRVTPPTPQTGMTVNFAEIGTRTTTMEVNPDERSMLFWMRIYDIHFVGGSGSSSSTVVTGFIALFMSISLLNLLT